MTRFVAQYRATKEVVMEELEKLLIRKDVIYHDGSLEEEEYYYLNERIDNEIANYTIGDIEKAQEKLIKEGKIESF